MNRCYRICRRLMSRRCHCSRNAGAALDHATACHALNFPGPQYSRHQGAVGSLYLQYLVLQIETPGDLGKVRRGNEITGGQSEGLRYAKTEIS